MKALYIILAIALTSCSAQKMEQIYTNTDFSKAQQPFAQLWVGGAPGSGSGVVLHFPAQVTEGKEVVAVYFRNKINKTVNYASGDKTTLLSHFRTDFNTRKDVIMDIDSNKEAQNAAPNIEKFPFELKDDEAVIALKNPNSKKITYVKLTNIEERSQLALPSIPQ